MNRAITSVKRMLPSTAWGVTVSKVALWGQTILSSARSILPPTIWDRGCGRVVGWVKDRELTWARNTLERRLAQIVETANGHRAQDLPSGSPAYVALYEQANSSIDDFCARHGVARLAVEQEAPVLRELEALTHAPSLGARLTKGLAILIAGIIGAMAIGGAGGLIAIGYHWIVRLLVR